MSKHHKTAIIFISVLLLLALLSLFVVIEASYFAMVIGIWFAIAIIGSSFIGSNYHIETYCSNPSETGKNIALTFDDGPHPMTIPILNLLKEHNAKATFFCIGKNISQYPEIAQRIVAEGHIIGNHSYNHSQFFDFYRKKSVLEELQRTDAIIEKISGRKPVLFRPPYGVTNPSIRRALAVTKHKVIGWNIRSLDGVVKNESVIFNRIAKRISAGGIVLLHDTSPQTVHVLERLLVTLREKNYKVVSLEHLLTIKAYED
jgi:peptidoglycan/xylan/chitin deacetylase (PgdA/CDA1 family)